MLIYKAIPKVAKAIGAISKDRKNEQQGYRFRGIDDVLNACHGPLTDNGVFVTTEVSELTREERQNKNGGVLVFATLRMKVSFIAEDGSSVSTTTYGEAMDSGDKATNKAMSAALKYAFFQTFTIPLENMDDADATTHDLAPRKEGDKDKAEFNLWAMGLVRDGKIQDVLVRQFVAKNGGDYKKARAEIEEAISNKE